LRVEGSRGFGHRSPPSHFAPFRANIIGINQDFESPCGRQRILYADWTASGRMFGRSSG
jgi:hypothetical protein